MTTLGQTYHAGAVLTMGRAVAEANIRFALDNKAHQLGVILGKVRYEERIDQEEGPILVGEADVVGYPNEAPGVTADLDAKDLARLRDITRKAHLKAMPFTTCEVCAGTKRDGYGNRCKACKGRGRVKSKPLTDAECDAIINEVAPETAHRVVKATVDSGMVH